MHRRGAFRLALLGSMAFASFSASHADTISIAWEALAHPQVSGYRVHYGTSSENYTLTEDVGSSAQTVLSGLSSCTDYYVSVKALAPDGTESAQFSNEISGWARPLVSSSTPPTLQRGTTLDVAIAGANYRAGVVVTPSNPGVTVNSVSVQGCNQLTANLSVAPNAALGAFDMIVSDATGTFGTGTGISSVTLDPTVPAIGDLQVGSIGSTTATISWTTDKPTSALCSYREVGETVYLQALLDGTLATAHSITLVGLSPNTADEYSVESTDANGRSVTQDGPSAFTTPPGQVQNPRREDTDF